MADIYDTFLPYLTYLSIYPPLWRVMLNSMKIAVTHYIIIVMGINYFGTWVVVYDCEIQKTK